MDIVPAWCQICEVLGLNSLEESDFFSVNIISFTNLPLTLNLILIQRKLPVTVQCNIFKGDSIKICSNMWWNHFFPSTFNFIILFLSISYFLLTVLIGKKPVYSMKLKKKKTQSGREMEKYKYVVIVYMLIVDMYFIRSPHPSSSVLYEFYHITGYRT